MIKKRKSKRNRDDQYFVSHIFPEKCPLDTYIPAIIGKKERIVVFGDIHGDYNLTLELFKKANLIVENNGKIIWTGQDTYVVQVGDQIDRCRPDIQRGLMCDNPKTTSGDEANDIVIMELFNDLNRQARLVGGAVISLLGNHEIMNVQGNLAYVSYEGLKQFENYIDKNNPRRSFQSGQEAREYAFQEGNEYGTMLGCTRLAVVIIGSNLFVHAGIINGLIKELQINKKSDFESINIKIRKWLLGLIDRDEIEHIIKNSETSMFWSRILGKIPAGTSLSDPKCYQYISNVINFLQVGSIIIGHTPQSFMENMSINSTCSGKVWRVDNGSSAAFNNFDKNYLKTGKVTDSRRVQYLEILNDNDYRVCDATGCFNETGVSFRSELAQFASSH
ncbi:MAG: metallophosphatase/phosphoesterase [Dasosvirus sp.]|uniref:Metallophosphatase/phosphoesterase n=1 Tax=Dasosvirus sp. TaxID=2487764 RepID=A0A3G4ZRM7_9VIRU|nr:MAG: metallophosphatase/phosphoesterase [Dasosvirus sp.]